MGISEAAMKEIHQKAQDEKQVLMKQAQVRSSTVWCGVTDSMKRNGEEYWIDISECMIVTSTLLLSYLTSESSYKR